MLHQHFRGVKKDGHMNRHALSVAAFVVILSSVASSQQTATLGTGYQVKVGDVAAVALSEILKLRPDLGPALVNYEPASGTIDVEAFGTPTAGSKTDQARATLGSYWEVIQALHIPYVERRYRIKLKVEHYRLMYYDRTVQEGPKLILQFVQGQYLMP